MRPTCCSRLAIAVALVMIPVTAAGQSPFAMGHRPPQAAARSVADAVPGEPSTFNARVPRVIGLVREEYDARKLLKNAIARSPTVEQLVQTLQGSRLTVLVAGTYLGRCSRGSLVPLRSSAEAPAVLVTVCVRNIKETRIAILGHELQHALEIAQLLESAPRWPLKAADFERVGYWRSGGRSTVESDKAIAVGYRVWRELCDPSLQRVRAARAQAQTTKTVARASKTTTLPPVGRTHPRP